MKAHVMELPFGKKTTVQNTQMIVFPFSLVLILMTIIPLCYPSLIPTIQWKSFSPSSSPPSSLVNVSDLMNVSLDEKCDIFTGEWIPNPVAPYYTNATCWAIHDHQNCMKHGRPDTDFMKWRWKPNRCELPLFDPSQFFELLRGKSLAFVGDSVGRNQMQSLICLLSRVEFPTDVSDAALDEMSRTWLYPNYNITIANFWSPYLVRTTEADRNGPTNTGLFNLYLDEFDEFWTTQIHKFDYVVISAGHWFFRPSMFYEDGQLVGCHYCLKKNITDLTYTYGYRKAFRTAFRAINSLENFNGITFLRTFAPPHYEHGEWNEGGDCVRTRPFKSNETMLNGRSRNVYTIQMEEFRVAEEEGEQRGVKFRLLDTTQATLLRPDGHPGRYGHKPQANATIYNDCVHWCLPGPIDAWNDFLLHMLKMESRRISDDKIYRKDRKMRVR